MTAAPTVSANGADIPVLGLGTWPLEGEACRQAVLWGLEAGYRHLDTARMYGNEAAVGEALRTSGVPRDEVFVTTKVWRDDIDAGALERAAEASLQRLGIDRIDLLLIHWPNGDVPLERSTAGLCAAKRSGLARHIGVSNYPSAMLDETVRLATEPLVANQVEYHPYLDQSAVLAACRRHGMATTSYCPLGRAAIFGDATVKAIADARGRTVAQVVLRWHIQQPGVVAIPKSGSQSRIRENLGALDFALSEDEMARISALANPDGRVIVPEFAPQWDEAA